MTGNKIITIAVILTLVSFVALSSNSQSLFAKTTKDKSNADPKTSTSQNKDKSNADPKTSTSQSLSSANTSSDLDKMQFQQFGTCLGIAAGKDSFATEKEVKNCFMIVYSSEPSSSSGTTSSSSSK
ncbi:MAG: hypothetical protein ACTHKJ_11165 [Candidatus Nitrosocosmicus sp.]